MKIGDIVIGEDTNHYKVVRSLGGNKYEIEFYQNRKQFFDDALKNAKSGTFDYANQRINLASNWFKTILKTTNNGDDSE